MFYHPTAYRVGLRDVVAAWLVCVAIAATGLAMSDGATGRTAPAIAAPAAADPPPASDAPICSVGGSNILPG